VLDSFIGEIQQIPPQYSAIKVNGKRAYKSAREGQVVDIKPRAALIKSIVDVRYETPKLSFLVDVSSGTYIRSLARDLGDKLGCGAYLSSLRRLTVGEYSVQAAHSMDGLNSDSIRNALFTLE
jgi:tRNA pseudouridine55 synthase